MNFIIKIFILISLCLGVFSSCTTSSKKNNNAKLALIDSNDRNSLELFFLTLMKDNEMAYTLFGSKPCSIADYIESIDNKLLFALKRYETVIFKNGWVTWEKYKNVLLGNNFIFHNISYGDGYHYFLLINKKETLKLLSTHIDFFREKLNQKISPEDILFQMQDSDFVQKFLHDSDVLGTLLGYGLDNARGFHKKRDLSLNLLKESFLYSEKTFEKLTSESKQIIKAYSNSLYKDSNYQILPYKLDQEISTLNDLMTNDDFFEMPKSDFLLDSFRSPVYKVFNNTSPFTNTFEEDREKISKAFYGRPFLEVVLLKLME